MKSYKFKIHGTNYSVDIKSVEGQTIELELNGTPYQVEVDKQIKQTPKKVVLANRQASPSPSAVATTQDVTPKKPSGGANSIKSPLPGTILDVFVNVGDTVKAGQKLMLLEAMKMENQIDADRDGVIKSVGVRKGDVIMEGDVLVTIE
ncbi:MAG: biotin/lipoyl-binding protein [Bacteroidales bacterium]|nr:biotin/lipoyl-binding protein [Bacteroidales bacterium]MBQ9312664.1 biotin/lipoyl-binding protein [Bacteroidales bacterium]